MLFHRLSMQLTLLSIFSWEWSGLTSIPSSYMLPSICIFVVSRKNKILSSFCFICKDERIKYFLSVLYVKNLNRHFHLIKLVKYQHSLELDRKCSISEYLSKEPFTHFGCSSQKGFSSNYICISELGTSILKPLVILSIVRREIISLTLLCMYTQTLSSRHLLF